MNQLRTLALFAALALSSIAVGCGGNNNTPPGTDAGHDAFVSTNDTGMPMGDGGADGGPTTPDGGSDAGSDAGSCVSTMPHCNTCTTAATDPFNACSSFVTGCIPFDNATRVPGWPDHIPAVTP